MASTPWPRMDLWGVAKRGAPPQLLIAHLNICGTMMIVSESEDLDEVGICDRQRPTLKLSVRLKRLERENAIKCDLTLPVPGKTVGTGPSGLLQFDGDGCTGFSTKTMLEFMRPRSTEFEVNDIVGNVARLAPQRQKQGKTKQFSKRPSSALSKSLLGDGDILQSPKPRVHPAASTAEEELAISSDDPWGNNTRVLFSPSQGSEKRTGQTSMAYSNCHTNGYYGR
ncbi:hypothetical protein TI39_contig4142g00009 [Zymoseptoria brevis]|uniref:Uncharacterized protein n=1 Tax=Zymoseptoria brevis TaxID=1047168 RepID=A0A0F4GCF9_9PEZI|nr:hypothetical protein TI39_contig4142g00009 [Zymoseptoria brevis]